MARAKSPRSSAVVRRIVSALEAQHPHAFTELQFRDAYELLVATIFSAQCTNARANMVTPELFKRYPAAPALSRATPGDLERRIKPTGFYRSKARSLIGMAAALVEDHGAAVPATMEDLVKLPGVGRKTANVVLGHASNVTGFPVDRHVLRVANRLGIAQSDDPEMAERQLCALLPPEEWTLASDTLIFHGRRVCKPKPRCDVCQARVDCPSQLDGSGVAPERGRRVRR